MRTLPSAPLKTSLVEPLSYKDSAANALVPVLIVLISGLILPLILKPQLDQQIPWVRLVEGGETLSGELGWILPVIITALIGFLAAALAGNSFADPVEADRLRRTLGYVGFLLGATGILIGAYVGIYAAVSDKWALYFGLIPSIAIIVFLALYVGRYVAYSGEEKLEALEAVMIRRKERLNYLEKRSFWPWWAALPLSSATIAVTGAAIALALNPAPTANLFLSVVLASFISCIVILAAGRVILAAVYADISKARFFTWVVPLSIYLIVLLSISVSMAQVFGTWAGFGGLYVGGACLFAQTFPRKFQCQALLNITTNGSAAALAHKQFAVREEKDIAERTRLQAAIAQNERRSWPERVLAAILRPYRQPPVDL